MLTRVTPTVANDYKHVISKLENIMHPDFFKGINIKDIPHELKYLYHLNKSGFKIKADEVYILPKILS